MLAHKSIADHHHHHHHPPATGDTADSGAGPQQQQQQQQQPLRHHHHHSPPPYSPAYPPPAARTDPPAPKRDQSIPALLNSDDDEHDFLPTPVTPAGAFSSILPLSEQLKHSPSAAAAPPSDAALTLASPSAVAGRAPQDDDHAKEGGASGKSRLATPNQPSATTEKLFACHECDQTFSRPHNLKSHLATHSSEKPFQCDICQHHFRRQHDLKRHRKLHTGERPYVCKRCSRPFARLDALNRHQRAEGGNACTSAVHQAKKVNAVERSRGASTPRRPIPQLHIAHPASQPLPDQPPSYPLPPHHPQHHHHNHHHHHHHQPYPASSPSTSSSPSPSSTAALLPSPAAPAPVASAAAAAAAAAPERRLPPLQTPTSPPAAAYHAWDRLEQENRALRTQVAQLRAACEQKDELQSLVHDLQVENKVLRSLIMDSQRADLTDDEPALKRSRLSP